jgi:hypothetical protein
MSNEAPFGSVAEKLHDRLAHSLARGVRVGMIEETLAAERRATVERIRAALDLGPCHECENADEIHRALDDEAAR